LSSLNASELASDFAEDGVYHNMPFAPVSGRANINAFIANFIKPWTATDWEILSLLCAGDIVFAERVDRQMGAKDVSLPCCGVQGGGNQVWRDFRHGRVRARLRRRIRLTSQQALRLNAAPLHDHNDGGR
jgi:limonene-1,2-epoxide hydrolase